MHLTFHSKHEEHPEDTSDYSLNSSNLWVVLSSYYVDDALPRAHKLKDDRLAGELTFLLYLASKLENSSSSVFFSELEVAQVFEEIVDD